MVVRRIFWRRNMTYPLPPVQKQQTPYEQLWNKMANPVGSAPQPSPLALAQQSMVPPGIAGPAAGRGAQRMAGMPPTGRPPQGPRPPGMGMPNRPMGQGGGIQNAMSMMNRNMQRPIQNAGRAMPQNRMGGLQQAMQQLAMMNAGRGNNPVVG